MMDRLTKLLEKIPRQHRALVAVVALVCATNGANHLYQRSGTDEMRGNLERIVQEMAKENCK